MTRGKWPETVSGRREAITCSVAICGGAPVRRGDEQDACPRVMHNGVPVVCPCGTRIGHHPATIQQPESLTRERPDEGTGTPTRPGSSVRWRDRPPPPAHHPHAAPYRRY